MGNNLRKNIGILTICTGKYDIFIDPLYESILKYFLVNHNVTIFLFTDTKKDLSKYNNVKKYYQEHRVFPYPTLYRYKTFVNHIDEFSDMDYLYYLDIDMLIVDNVGDEILGERVVTIHPGFNGGRGTPETRTESTACILPHEQLTYFCGGFNGGSRLEFLKLCKTINANVDSDANNGITAIWHDESHFNRYYVDNKPTIILNQSYCYPESWNLPYHKKILALDKNHEDIRKL